MKELQEKLLALSADAYAHHQVRGDSFALQVADVTAGLALRVKQLTAAAQMQALAAESTPLDQLAIPLEEYPPA